MEKRRGLFNSNLNLCFVFEAKCSLPSLCNVTVSKRLILNHSSQVSRTRGCFSFVPMNKMFPVTLHLAVSFCYHNLQSNRVLFIPFDEPIVLLFVILTGLLRSCEPILCLDNRTILFLLTFTIFSKVVSIID